MIKTTKYYIVVFLTLILTQTKSYAQYNGGIGDGAITDVLTLTSCSTPPSSFYAYFGGIGDGSITDLVNYTACGTPPQDFAYMGGIADGSVTDLLTLTACATPPSQFFAYMGGTSDGAVLDQLTLTACATPPPHFYAYMGGISDGFGVDSFIVCPTIPPVAAFSGSPTTICVGSTVAFTDLSTNIPSTWSWVFPGGTPGTSTSQNPTITYNTAGTYAVTLTATNAHGSDVETIAGYITVNPLPTANAGTNVSICTGSTTTLGASGGTSYSWLPATGLSSTTIANPVANPTTTTNYTVTVTSLGCTATDVVTVTVNPIPTANAGPDAAFCAGSSTTLGASGGGTYSWLPAFAGLSSTVIANPIATPSITTTYTVTVTVAGCTSTDAVTVTVNPTPTANAGTDVTICNGASTTLAATGGPGYSWSPATGLSSTTIANPIATPSTTTNYTLTVTNAFGCTNTDVVIVTVNPLPSANAGTDVSICNGSSTTLGASGGTAYSWLPATGLSSTTISNPVANPTATTNYTVTVTNSGCTATDVVTVTVNPIPTANAGTDVTMCNGSSTTLAASGGTSYAWLPATGLSSTIISNPVANPTATTNYTVTVTDGGCTDTDVVIVTLNPTPTANAGTDVSICDGSSTTLTATGGPGYSWSPATGLSSTTIANPIANPSVTTNYTVTVTNAFGCTSTDVVIVTVNPLGTASITPSGATTFCQGDSVTLTANVGSGYNWSTTATTQTITVMLSGTYTVSVSDLNGCFSPSASIVVTVNANPSTPTISANGTTNLCIGDTVILTSDVATSYLWSTGATSDSIIVTTAGTYSVTNYNSFGCGASSLITTVNVNSPLADFVGDTLLVFIPSATVIFSATTSGVPPYTYLWNFGDTTTSILASPSHTYATIGYKTVSLTVTDSTGCSQTITKPSYIQVEQLFPSWAMVTGTTLDLTGVSFIDAQTGIMSLTDGNCLISADSGNTWSPLPTLNIEPLTGAFVIPGNWFVTGNNGTILLSTNNGTSWTPFVTGTSETFNGSYFSSSSNGFAVGTNGMIQKYDGISWTPESSGVSEDLNHVYTFNASDATAVGQNQTILKYNGVSWLPQTAPVSFDIKGIQFSSALEGYAAGTNGVIIKTIDGGTTWTPSLSGVVDVDFNSIEVSGSDSAWACGTGGIVYTTIDDGATWIRYSVGYTTDQKEIIVTGGKGHVVGQGGNGRNFGDGGGLITGSSTTSIAEVSTFNVFPNPAQDNFMISTFFSDPKNISIEIKDANGKRIETIVNSNISGKFEANISTEHYSNGVYFIHIMEENKSWVQKIVIVK